MKRFSLPAIVLVVGCSSNPAGSGDAGADVATPVETGSPDTYVDPNTPYEHAVLAAQWRELPTGPMVPGGKQDDAFFLDADHGWVASGPNFALYQTKDGGSTWTQAFSNPGTYFRALLFTDATHGFAGNLGAGLDSHITDANILYATSNGGMTWQPVPGTSITGAAAAGVCNFAWVDATHLVAVGRTNGPPRLVASSDGGNTWVSTDISSTFMMVIDAYFTSFTSGLVVGMDNQGYANVAATADGGKTFTTKFTSKTSNSLSWKVSFPSAMVGYLAVQDTTNGPPSFAKTTDGGDTWAELPLNGVKTATGGAFPAVGVGFITDNVGWMSPDDAALPTYVTTDGGNTWNQDPTLRSPINRFRFVDMNTAYAVGAAVWKLSITFP